MKHIFIINPSAGKTDSTKFWTKQIKEVFREKEYIIENTKYEHHAEEIAHRYALTKEDICIYVCGGDGTLTEVVSGVFGFPNVCIAIIPIGTGNDFIRSFSQVERADFLKLENYEDGEEIISDLLYCDNQYCLNIASVGFDAAVVQRAPYYKRLSLVGEKFAYNLSLLHCFLSSIHFKHSLLLDGEQVIPEASYLFVVAANGKFYGGGFQPTPMAKIDDGQIEVLTISSLSRFRILGLLGIYRRGKHLKYSFAKHYSCKKIKIMSSTAVVLNMDGETREVKDPEIQILPQAIRIRLPKKKV